MMGRALDDVSAQGYLFHYRNIEINCHADMMVDVNYIYLHLDRFDKSAAESVSLLDQFAFALKHMEGQDSRPEDFSREEMQNLYDTAMFANLSPEQAHTIEINKTMTTENDWLVAIHEEAERALARGLAEGEAKGEAKLKQTAAKLKKLGVSVADIATATGLPEDVVEAL